MPKMNLICGIVGPLIVGRIATVPLWIALALKKGKNCEIVSPFYLQLDFLERISSYETEHIETISGELPEYFFDVAEILLRHAIDNFEKPEYIRIVVQNIADIRHKKITKILLKNIHKEFVNISGITCREIALIKPFVEEASLLYGDLKMEYEKTAVKDAQSTTNSQTKSFSNFSSERQIQNHANKS